MKLIPKQQNRGGALEPWVPFDHIDDTTNGGSWSVDTSRGGGYVQGVDMTPDGSRLFFVEETTAFGTGGGNGNLTYFDMNTPFDLGTAEPEYTFQTDGDAPIDGVPVDVNFSEDGMHMYLLRWIQPGAGAALIHYELAAPWDITGFDRHSYVDIMTIPGIIFGYTRSYLTNMDISQDGRRVYFEDKTVTLLTDNPDSKEGVLFVYELTTPFDVSTMVEHSVFVLSDQWIEFGITRALTVFTRGHHVDQICAYSVNMINFNYPNGLEHKYVKDGGAGGDVPSDYHSMRVHKYVRGYSYKMYGQGLGGSLPGSRGQAYNTVPG